MCTQSSCKKNIKNKIKRKKEIKIINIVFQGSRSVKNQCLFLTLGGAENELSQIIRFKKRTTKELINQIYSLA